MKVQHKQIRPGEFGAPSSPQGGQAVYVDAYGAPVHPHGGGDVTADGEGGHIGAAAGLPEVPSVENDAGEAAESGPSASAVPPFETKVPTPNQVRSGQPVQMRLHWAISMPSAVPFLRRNEWRTHLESHITDNSVF